MREGGEKMREVGKGDERGGYEGRCEECVDSFLENSALKANKHMTHEEETHTRLPCPSLHPVSNSHSVVPLLKASSICLNIS